MIQETAVNVVRTLTLAVLLTAPARGAELPTSELSPLALFNRCYATLTRSRPSPTHPAYAAIKAGKLSPIKACSDVLEAARFDAKGGDAGERKRVIQTFSDFHRTWFSADDYLTAVPVGEIFAYSMPL